jgi:hypothetical protein
MAASKAWEKFDRLVMECVRAVMPHEQRGIFVETEKFIGEALGIGTAPSEVRDRAFDAFLASPDALPEFDRIVRGCARRRRLPRHWDLEDVRHDLIMLTKHYLLDRVYEHGVIGFGPNNEDAMMPIEGAGAFVRKRINRKMDKIISAAKGEDKHSRLGKSRPEYLSKTGELPDVVVQEAATSERAAALALARKRCRTNDDFVVLDALEKSMVDFDDCLSLLVAQGDFRTKQKASTALEKFLKKVNRRPAQVPNAA